MILFVEAVGLAAPGLPSWRESLPVLRGERPYEPLELEKYKPTQLPPNERRRAPDVVRMAFRVAEDLAQTCDLPAQYASVFASSGGDYPVIDQICRALREPGRPVSPTHFHNSVHNSAAGYWSIATGNRATSTSISAYDASFATGLLEAGGLCLQEQVPTLLVVYDIKPPPPLLQKREITADFGLALLLSPAVTDGSLAQVTIRLADAAPTASAARQPTLERLRLANPAARALPLLEYLACRESGRCVLAGDGGPALQLEVACR